jgi:dephospho-CoA kinase
LSVDDGDTLVVAGTAANQSKFYVHFDHIVLLSAPAAIILERLASRKNNSYGATPRTRARVLEHIETVEPMLRAGADHEIDTSCPLGQVIESVLRILQA